MVQLLALYISLESRSAQRYRQTLLLAIADHTV